MRKIATLIYGAVAYGVCAATLVYLIGFSSGKLVSTSVDVGPAAP